MNTVSICQKLHQYISVADESKLQAISRMIESDFTNAPEWWEDSEFISKLDSISDDLKTGADRGIVWDKLKKELLKEVAN